jgi:hypothetical protein
VCIKKLPQIDPRLAHVSVYDDLWAAPFWSVETYLKAHQQASCSHAIQYNKLKQNQLLPPVDDKNISTHNKKRKRYASAGEKGKHLLQYSNKHKNKTCTICGENGHNKRKCASSSTRMLVEKSTAFKEIVEGGSFNPIRVDVDDIDDEGYMEAPDEVWRAIETSEVRAYKQQQSVNVNVNVIDVDEEDKMDLWTMSANLQKSKKDTAKLKEQNAVVAEQNRILQLKVDALQEQKRGRSDALRQNKSLSEKVECKLCTWLNTFGSTACDFCGTIMPCKK